MCDTSEGLAAMGSCILVSLLFSFAVANYCYAFLPTRCLNGQSRYENSRNWRIFQAAIVYLHTTKAVSDLPSPSKLSRGVSRIRFRPYPLQHFTYLLPNEVTRALRQADYSENSKKVTSTS
jgi:hypothetical protein